MFSWRVFVFPIRACELSDWLVDVKRGTYVLLTECRCTLYRTRSAKEVDVEFVDALDLPANQLPLPRPHAHISYLVPCLVEVVLLGVSRRCYIHRV